ncbi:glycosyltransferase family 2 protein [Streptomyces scopuliridis]|uniref:Glycosyltransferase family 2 protein n=1 Tax=Streptomyces scopuliridis TaxID=452529 RepID=A0ACD4ZL65_9ACTN|nr:dolichyl-phosphate beta-glucosyltransferase [Streptomyces scopuliridis]WSB98733.1 glycosyltransferase family 2 protein [Streptomyces scopuliridis]WSC07564.1 glycosyltransferase family 2 protein [Streptomyces scopuliridis]
MADVANPSDVAGVDLSVVIPAYNEERRLRPTLDAIRAHLRADPDRWGTWELIVVDDGSTDGTAAVAAEAAAGEPRVRVVTGGGNHGKGHALRRGVLASNGRRVLLTDADLATPIDELDRLDKQLTADGGGAAIGSRAHPDARIEVRQLALREWLGRLGNRLIRLVAVDGIADTQCGFKLFDGERARAAFAGSRLDGWGIDVEILRFFRRSGWPVTEVPVRWAHQPGSKVRPLDYGRVLLELVRLRAAGGAPGTRSPAYPGHRRRTDLIVGGLFLLASFFLYKGLWADLDHAYLADAGSDQNQWEWFFRVTADNVTHLRNPLFTTLQNFPDGVNLMANTVMLGLSVPLTPVTLAFGPTVTWALVLTLGLAATALAWYWLFARRLVRGRWAAALGAALAAFAPPMMSHANAHPNFLVLFMIPVIIDRALRLCEGRRVVRDGVLLGLFATYQIFLGEEPLLLAVMGTLLFALAYAAVDRERARAAVRPLLRGLGWALMVCLPLVAVPLYWQFFGPQSYHSVLHGDGAGNSPLAFLQYSGRSLFGDEATADRLAMNRTEQNAFYGWPLIALAFGIGLWLWRAAVVRALAFTALAAALLSLGPKIRIPFTDVVLTGPWRILAHQPLFESVIESRVAMICAPALGALVALAADRIADRRAEELGLMLGGAALEQRRRLRLVAYAALAAALLPIVPTPLPVRERPDVPAFIADGTYRRYVGEGETVVPVPVPDPGNAEALHWQSASGLGFSVPGGYFNGPWGEERMGIYGAPARYTSNLLRDVRYSGQVPVIDAKWRAQARFDLAFWKAGVVVLGPQPNDAALYETLEKLLGGPGKRVGGAWIWDLPPTG